MNEEDKAEYDTLKRKVENPASGGKVEVSISGETIDAVNARREPGETFEQCLVRLAKTWLATKERH